MSPWAQRGRRDLQGRIPSMMDALLCASEMAASSGSGRVSNRPGLGSKHLGNEIAYSIPGNVLRHASRCLWGSPAPLMNRTHGMPKPYRFRMSFAISFSRGWWANSGQFLSYGLTQVVASPMVSHCCGEVAGGSARPASSFDMQAPREDQPLSRYASCARPTASMSSSNPSPVPPNAGSFPPWSERSGRLTISQDRT